MRLNRLDLTRFGKFTDRSLRFDQTDGPDLHLIYGPNEAGKSTLFTAWLDLLFGIEARSPYAFLHPYSTMQIGAELRVGDQVLQVIRTKGNANTLKDPLGNTLPETLLQGGIGAADRKSFAAMFSLDDDTIEEGGKSILDSQGDLGQLLFSASAGLSGLSASMSSLRDATSVFIKRQGPLTEAKTALATIESQMADLDTDARHYAAMVQAHEQAVAVHAAAVQAQSEADAEVAVLLRQVTAAPQLVRLQQDEVALQALGPQPDVPEGWAEEVTRITQSLIGLKAGLEGAMAQQNALQTSAAKLRPDPEVLSKEPSIIAARALKSAYDEARKDLPNRRADADRIATQIATLIAALGQSGTPPEQVLPAFAQRPRIRELVRERPVLEAALSKAVQEQDRAIADLAAAQDQMAEAGAVTQDTGALSALLADLARQDPEQTHARAMRAQEAAVLAQSQAMLRMAPWQGTAEELASLSLPHQGQLVHWAEALQTARRRLDRAQNAAESAAAALEAAQADPGDHVAILAQAVQARSDREKAWAAHMARLTVETAREFERALRLDDDITSQRTAIARAEVLAGQAASLVRDLAGCTEELTAAKALVAAIEAEISATMPPACEGFDLDDLRRWMGLREAALTAIVHAQSAGLEVSAAARALADAQKALVAGLAAITTAPATDIPFALALAQSKALCAAAELSDGAQRRVKQVQAALAGRTAEVERAKAQLDQWHAAWDAVCTGHWLAAAAGDVPTLQSLMEQFDTLQPLLHEQGQLQDRIAKMRGNIDRFEQAVAALAPGAQDTLERWQALEDRLVTARQTLADAARIAGEQALQAQQAEDLAAKIAELNDRLSEMAGYLGLANPGDLAATLAAARTARDLQGNIARVTHDLCEALQVLDLAAVRAQLDSQDIDTLRGMLAQAQADAKHLAGRVQEAAVARAEAERQTAAVGGDDRVAHLTAQRETLLLGLEAEARAALRRSLGVMAVDQALHRYREAHRSAMLEKASQAFAVISRGAYTGLAALADGPRDVLVALARDGGSKQAQDLSKGTRFQLYLALRVAGYHAFAQSRAAVPFVADDIMETFDDDRAAEAFSLLSGMAQVGQVIYLTHHRHLIEIARDACPQVHVHIL